MMEIIKKIFGLFGYVVLNKIEYENTKRELADIKSNNEIISKYAYLLLFDDEKRELIIEAIIKRFGKNGLDLRRTKIIQDIKTDELIIPAMPTPDATKFNDETTEQPETANISCYKMHLRPLEFYPHIKCDYLRARDILAIRIADN